MTTPTFETAKQDYEIQKTAYLAELKKIPNEDSLPDDSKKKIAKAKQLYAFVAEQERYFEAFVKDREDAIKYIESITDVLTLANEILTDVNGLSPKQQKDEKTTVGHLIPKTLDDYDKKLIEVANDAPGKPNYLKFGIKLTLATVVPISLAIILAIFVSPAAFLLLIPWAFISFTDTGKRILGRDLISQPGSLSAQIHHLRIFPYLAEEMPYQPRLLPGLDPMEMQHEYSPEFWYKKGKANETATPIELPPPSSLPEAKG